MRKSSITALTFCLLLMTFAISAQNNTTNFAGDWKLDVKKSELGQRSRIESMTMKVAQTANELAYERKAKRTEREGGGGRRRGGRGGNAGKVIFKLDGTETSAEISGGRLTGKATYKAETKDSKLILSTTRSFETPNGTRSIKSVETWELSKDSKILTVISERNTRRGAITSKMVFTK